MHNKHSSISFIQTSCTLFYYFIHFKLPWITRLSNLSNCLLGEGKTCFHSTKNNVMLLFSKDTSYEGIIFDKSFICNFVLHVYESHTNVGISIQSFTCHHTVIQGQKFYINPKIYHLSFLSCDVQCTCQSYQVWCNVNFGPTDILSSW